MATGDNLTLGGNWQTFYSFDNCRYAIMYRYITGNYCEILPDSTISDTLADHVPNLGEACTCCVCRRYSSIIVTASSCANDSTDSVIMSMTGWKGKKLLMHGREAQLPIDLVYGPSPDEAERVEPHGYVDRVQQSLWKIHQKARDKMAVASMRQKTQYDLHIFKNKYTSSSRKVLITDGLPENVSDCEEPDVWLMEMQGSPGRSLIDVVLSAAGLSDVSGVCTLNAPGSEAFLCGAPSSYVNSCPALRDIRNMARISSNRTRRFVPVEFACMQKLERATLPDGNVYELTDPNYKEIHTTDTQTCSIGVGCRPSLSFD
ncbi:unnamed protein product [Mytilus edulis]|uniref:Uncharacterized protein n=1 Tax=Mytilus edulis TaxID=6550 RepID=A0A8S3TTV6_MYTED|nr:unnamed protein product [Mytilus edulis]